MKIHVTRTSERWSKPEGEEREFLSLDDCIRQLSREEVGYSSEFIVSVEDDDSFSVEIYDDYRE